MEGTVIQLVRELGSFGVLLWLVVWTAPRILAELREHRYALRELVEILAGAEPAARSRILSGRLSQFGKRPGVGG